MILFEDLPEVLNIKIQRSNARSLRESIVKLLEEAIYSGYFPPGLRLIESHLADKLEMSRTPIREALLQLESQGLVKIVPNKGAVVTPFSTEEVEETYMIFGALNGVAAGLSAASISDDEIVQMETLMVKMENCVDDKKEWFALNNQLHSTFLRPCKKKILLKSIKNYTRQVGRYWYLFLTQSKYMKSFNEDHRKILEAFKLRNSKMAREEVENHVESFGKILVESLRNISPIEWGYPMSESIWGKSRAS